MSILVPSRRLDPEWIDRPDNPPRELERALRELRAVNVLLGGRRALLRALDPYLDGLAPGRALRVLDVGAGGGDQPIAMVEHARRRAASIEVTALDRDPVTARFAAAQTRRNEQIRVIRADALSLPFGPRAFDVVTASLFLHHFEHAQTVRLMCSFRRMASRAVLINDLRRHLVPWLFIYLASRLTLRTAMFTHDGPLSVLRGFTSEELRAAARQCGVYRPRLERCWPFRLVLTLPGEGPAA